MGVQTAPPASVHIQRRNVVVVMDAVKGSPKYDPVIVNPPKQITHIVTKVLVTQSDPLRHDDVSGRLHSLSQNQHLLER